MKQALYKKIIQLTALTIIAGAIVLPGPWGIKGAAGVLSALQQTGCTPETEPNDTAPDALSFNGACLEGSLGEGDTQDLWRWTVSPAAAESIWRLSLGGLPTGLTSAELFAVTWLDNGEVSSQERLFKLDASNGETVVADLLLMPGDYILGTAAAGGEGSYQVALEAVALPPPGEVEPNDRQVDANGVDGSFVLSARADNDWFLWTLPADTAARQVELALQAPLGVPYSLTLHDASGNLLVGRTQPSNGSEWRLHDLLLPPGEYLINVNSNYQGRGTAYTLRAESAGAPDPLVENEPNDLFDPLPFVDGVQGRLAGDTVSARDDVDAFLLLPGDLPPDRHFDLVLESDSDEDRSFCLYSELLVQLHCRQGRGRVSLVDLALPDVPHLLVVDGNQDVGEQYRIGLQTGSLQRPQRETEPNDTIRVAPDLPSENGVMGRFVGDEVDTYRFVTSGPARLWRFQAVGETVSWIELLDAGGDSVVRSNGTHRISDLELLPGTHYIRVRGETGNYVVRALSQGEPDRNRETEPNDQELLANRLAFDQTRRGILDGADVDSYRFRLYNFERVRLDVVPPPDGSIQLILSGHHLDGAQSDERDLGVGNFFEGELLPGDYTVTLRSHQPSDSAYSITLERLNPFGADDLTGVSPALSLSHHEIAAYSPWWQQIAGTLSIRNQSGGVLTLELEAHLTQADWELNWERASLELQETAEIPFAVTIPPDVPAGAPVILTARVQMANGQSATTNVSITPGRTAEPVNATHAFELDESLLGMVNAASLGLGAAIVTEDERLATAQMAVNDRLGNDSDHLILDFGVAPDLLPVEIGVDLAGTGPLPLRALLLHPQGAAGTRAVSAQLREFELQLSLDGQNYETALAGVLSPQRREQLFLLDPPVEARFARLRLLSNYGDPGRMVLDEWKLLVDAADLAAAQGQNLADPALGGDVVWMDIPDQGFGIPGFDERESVLTADPHPWRLQCDEACETLAWVISFHQQRAAQISEISWVDVPELSATNQWDGVEVFAGLETPFGPWQSIGRIELAGRSGEHTLSLPTPAWARYVKFEIAAPSAPYFNHFLPAQVRILERLPGDDYRTILGEWGWGSRDAAYEWLKPLSYRPVDLADGNDTATTAQPLTAAVNGHVAIGIDEDWYTVTIPDGSNTVEFLLGGQPTADVAAALFTTAGLPVALVRDEERSTPAQQLWRAVVEPGATYQLRVYEPQRSIVFAWDSSGSVEPYRPTIYQALARFAESVTPQQETVNLWPFGRSQLLLPAWESDPTLILQGLQNYDRAIESSETGRTLLNVSEQLGARTGSRALVLIGDFDLSDQEPIALWKTLRFAQPHVYALRVAHITAGGAHADTQMQHWASVHDGDARYAPAVSDLELGFDRAATRLRRPAAYSLEAAYSFTAPPGPGALRVVSQVAAQSEGEAPTTLGETAVEIILDASGSMLQSLNGQRRIDAAKNTLLTLTNDVLAPGTPVALRIFGHVEGNFSCRTDLEVPLQPLDPETLSGWISAVEPKSLANTPLAASLALVADDLANAVGQKVVILVTDGEETCDGDPAAAITALQEQGVDVRVNIVGFAIGDAALKQQFEAWAALGGGGYFDAADASQLNAALQQALRVPFRVLAADGIEVGRGFVNGDPLTLPAGVYTVDVLAEPIIRFEQVVISGDREATLLVEGDR
jgi:hypothetical protein